jgi:site-specific DNA-methyltransferase (adenine-specific)
MAARVEVLLSERFNVLNRVVWVKGDANGNGRHAQACKESLRAWFPRTENIIFAEHYGSDNIAKSEAGYDVKCDELRGFVFEPLRKYLDDERKRAGFGHEQVHQVVGSVERHYFVQSQWMLPTREKYEMLRAAFNRNAPGAFLRREYDDLRREYDDLRREYENLRRPFNVSADVPYTDVWNFPTVQFYKGKHPCEKPLDMIRHIVRASSRKNSFVLDPFAGSGTTGVACINECRMCILIEQDETYYKILQKRINGALLPEPKSLFD